VNLQSIGSESTFGKLIVRGCLILQST